MNRSASPAFTVLELMIAISILAILTAIALPTFERLDLKAKTTEVKMNLSAIRKMESFYLAEFGSYVEAAATPGSLPGPLPGVFSGGGRNDFEALGFVPEGQVYFQYGVSVDRTNVLAYTADAQGDLDGDGQAQIWGFRHADPAGNALSRAGPNGCAQVDIGTRRNVLDTVGPCGVEFGQSIF